MNTIRIGTRDSQLALWQAEWVKNLLMSLYPDVHFRLVPMKTKGDKILDVALSEIGDKGLFTKELERGLLDGDIDLAVHSLKDLPTKLPEGLEIAAFCEREEPRDVLLSKNGFMLDRLPPGSVIGTSSLRRKAQLKHYRPDLVFTDIRGNLETRWRKLQESSGMVAIVLAAAGVIRLGWEERVTQILPEKIVLPAVGQGVIAVEIDSNNHTIREMLVSINHYDTELAVRAERALLNTLEGGCQVPIGTLAKVQDEVISLDAMVAGLDGGRLLRAVGEGTDPEQIGIEVAEKLIGQGAGGILEDIKRGLQIN